ncbi:hypothetical protein [Cupriavidus sp. Agwp_2]|uniref:hypothetical protein n=1 Tax=Cupriavidus sp. Agwp_2 TaxID=2897324 RepID=UPI0034612CB7
MSEIKVHASSVDELSFRAVLDQQQILELVAQAVAAQAGVDLDASNVSVRILRITSRSSGSLGTSKAEAVCEIVVDRRPQESTGPA